MSCNISTNEQVLLQVWNSFLVLPGTEAKFITKSRSLELLPGRIPSAETKAWICTADDCFNVPPQLHKTCCCMPYFVTVMLLNT